MGSGERDIGPAWYAVTLPGVALGLLLAAFSTTPSLLPRPPFYQGVVAGVAFAAGYLVGALAWVLAGRVIRWRHRALGRGLWVALGVAAVASAWPVVAASARTQADLRAPLGGDPLTAADGWLAFGVAVGIALGCLLLGKGLRALYRGLASGLARGRRTATDAVPWRARLGSATLLTGLAVLVAVLATVGVAASAERSYVDYNATHDSWVYEPSSAYRSAGPGSELSWDNAGREGRFVLGGGPSSADIASVTSRDALTPIRVYVGVDEPGGWTAHAAAAVRELQRTGAQDRSVRVVAAPPGTGWLDPQSIDSVEYLHHGDTALVAMQYTKTESWESFLFHHDAYLDSTRALLGAVHDWWAALPANHRPKLYLWGLSLGARAIQDQFADGVALRDFADGAVLAGTPYGTPLNAGLTDRRDPGSKIVLPVLDGGRAFRWYDTGQRIAEDAASRATWREPRVLFLQHGNDPIVWVGPPIAWSQPDWLAPAQRSAQVHPEMRWYPIVTGLQTMLDTEMDLVVPDGAGHRYGEDTLEAWIAVTGDGGNAPDTLDAIRQKIAGDSLPAGGDESSPEQHR